jgi:hypothetical protein
MARPGCAGLGLPPGMLGHDGRDGAPKLPDDIARGTPPIPGTAPAGGTDRGVTSVAHGRFWQVRTAPMKVGIQWLGAPGLPDAGAPRERDAG